MLHARHQSAKNIFFYSSIATSYLGAGYAKNKCHTHTRRHCGWNWSKQFPCAKVNWLKTFGDDSKLENAIEYQLMFILSIIFLKFKWPTDIVQLMRLNLRQDDQSKRSERVRLDQMYASWVSTINGRSAYAQVFDMFSLTILFIAVVRS